MKLTAEQINELKSLGLITSTLPAATILEHADTVDLAKIYRYIGVTVPSEDIEKAIEITVPSEDIEES